MAQLKWLAALVLLLIVVHPGFADDSAKLVGTWKAVSFVTEYQSTGAREDILGKSPTGYTIYTAEGRVLSLITAAGRKAATTDQERAGLWRSMAGYSGTYRVEGDTLIAKLDVSSMPTWVGTERVWLFRIDGDRLQQQLSTTNTRLPYESALPNPCDLSGQANL
jgi:hypothetical protein